MQCSQYLVIDWCDPVETNRFRDDFKRSDEPHTPVKDPSVTIRIHTGTQ